ncbi:MAG: sporulation integral membrane protein YtvI [Bacillota bacterium]
MTWLYLGAGLLLGFLTLKFVLPYLLPFVLAAFIAVLIDPLVSWMARRLRMRRGLAVAVVLLVVLAALTAGIITGVSRLAVEAKEITDDLPRWQNMAEGWLSRLGELSMSLPDPVRQAIENQMATVSDGLSALADSLVNSLAGLPRAMMFIVVTCLATFFISRDKREINRFLVGLLPEAWRGQARAVEREVLSSFLGYIRAQLVLVLLTAVGCIIGLGLVGAPYALLIGVGAGILDLFPMIGPATLFLPWGLYHVFLGDHGLGLRLLIVLGVVTAVRQLIEARVIGARIGLHPLATLMAIYLGLAVFGGQGLLIGPLAAVVLKALAQSGLWPNYGQPSVAERTTSRPVS